MNTIFLCRYFTCHGSVGRSRSLMYVGERPFRILLHANTTNCTIYKEIAMTTQAMPHEPSLKMAEMSDEKLADFFFAKVFTDDEPAGEPPTIPKERWQLTPTELEFIRAAASPAQRQRKGGRTMVDHRVGGALRRALRLRLGRPRSRTRMRSRLRPSLVCGRSGYDAPALGRPSRVAHLCGMATQTRSRRQRRDGK